MNETEGAQRVGGVTGRLRRNEAVAQVDDVE